MRFAFSALLLALVVACKPSRPQLETASTGSRHPPSPLASLGPDVVAITPGDTLTRRVDHICASGTVADTLVLVSYDAEQIVLGITRTWHAKPGETLASVSARVAPGFGPAVRCEATGAPGTRAFLVWERPPVRIQLDAFGADSSFRWSVRLLDGLQPCAS